MHSLIPILIVISLAGVGVLADYFLKLSGNGAKYIYYPYFFLGMIIYALTAFGWFFVMKYIKLSTLGIFYAVTTLMLLAIIGVFVFKEQLSIYEIVGIIFGIASIIILARFG